MSKSQTKQRATDLSVKDNGLAILTIDTPGKLNVLSPPVFEELDSRFDEIAADNRVTAVVIKSGKPGSFVAGADIKFLNTITTTEEGAEMSRAAQGVFNKLEDLKVPVVCAIDGVCLGGGLEMALACHYRLVSENPATVLGLPEVQPLDRCPATGEAPDHKQRCTACSSSPTAWHSRRKLPRPKPSEVDMPILLLGVETGSGG